MKVGDSTLALAIIALGTCAGSPVEAKMASAHRHDLTVAERAQIVEAGSQACSCRRLAKPREFARCDARLRALTKGLKAEEGDASASVPSETSTCFWRRGGEPVCISGSMGYVGFQVCSKAEQTALSSAFAKSVDDGNRMISTIMRGEAIATPKTRALR